MAGKKGDSAMSERDRIMQLRGIGIEGPRRGLGGIYPEVGVMLVTRGARFGDLPPCNDQVAVSVDCRIIIGIHQEVLTEITWDRIRRSLMESRDQTIHRLCVAILAGAQWTTWQASPRRLLLHVRTT